MKVVTLSKHQAVGNDFLVLVDEEQRFNVGPHHARAWCDRRRGIGADGLIVVTAGSDRADVTMTLFNADGSVAEISGNGIRCLGQAVAMDRGLGELDLVVATGSGNRNLQLRASGTPGEVVASVEMGELRTIPSQDVDDVVARSVINGHLRSLGVNVGNPHTVVFYEDQAERDRVADCMSAGASNVELVLAGSSPEQIAMRVVERGVGETLACGSGACAAAFATRSWGITGDHVRVAMPGGEVTVDLNGDQAVLSGPTTYVARILMPWP